MTKCEESDTQGTVTRTIQCDHGCCGTSVSQQCCEYSLSDTVIIVACVVGALLVVAIVIVLIICISNNKKQDRVVRIRPPRRGHEHVRRRVELPKPPPYSELPPEYTPTSNGNVYHTGQSQVTATDSRYSSFQRPQRNDIRSYPVPPPSTSVSISSLENRQEERLQNNKRQTRKNTQQPLADKRTQSHLPVPTKIPRRIDTPSTSSTRAASTSTAGRSVSTVESQLPGVPVSEEVNNSANNRLQREAARSAILRRLQARQVELESPTDSCDLIN